MISLTVDDENGWLEVIQLLRDWKSKGCREARIDLKLKVQKRVMVVGVENPPHTTPHIMSDDDTDYISSRRRAKIAKLQEEERDDKKRRNKKSATEKALDDEQGHRDADAAAEHYTTNIIEQNRCKTKACSVDAIPCRIIRGQHVRCTVAEIGAWSAGIVKHIATFTEPPPALLAKMDERADIANAALDKKRKKKGVHRSRSRSWSDGSRGRKRSRGNAKQNQPDMDLGQAMQGVMMSMLANQFSQFGHVPGPARVPQQELTSSPVRPAKVIIKLSSYIRHLMKKGPPAEQPAWIEALELMETNFVSYDDLVGLLKDDLLSIGIPLGIAFKIKNGVKKYTRKIEAEGVESSESGGTDVIGS
jgi:hypothetical protein